MKNKLLFVSAIGISSLVSGQSFLKTAEKYMLKNMGNTEFVISENKSDFFTVASTANKKLIHPPVNTHSTVSSISVIDMGMGPNAIGVSAGARTYLWADPMLNAIIFSHRSNFTATGDGSSGWLRYDYSKDGGMTWAVDQGPSYISNNGTAPPFANARYPQGVLYNPAGNTDPDSAYMSYFAPSLTASNSNWGGHVHGTVQTSGQLASTRTEEFNNRYEVPEDFMLTKMGNTYSADFAKDLVAKKYTDTVYIAKGSWDYKTRDFDYTYSKLAAPVSTTASGSKNYFGVNKLTFADDGMTGYFAMLGHSDFNIQPDSVGYLIVYKTTDGGATWQSPMNVSLYGAAPLLPLDSGATKFTAGFELDMVVDKDGNPHIMMPISPALKTAFSITGAGGYFGLFDVYSTNGGSNWMAKLIATPQTLSGTFGVSATDATNPSTVEYNRCQTSRNWNGDKLFFTWFDTDTNSFKPVDNNHANMNPNAFIIGYDITRHLWTAPISTAGSSADGAVTYGCASYYVFDDNAGMYTVPVAYQELIGDATKTGSPTQFHYLSGMSFMDSDFNISDNSVPLTTLISVNELKKGKNGVEISQNYPNPFQNSTSFNLTLAKAAVVSVEVYNTIGQKVNALDSKSYGAGSHVVTIDGSNFTPGVYFYTVRTNETSVTQRMIVK